MFTSSLTLSVCLSLPRQDLRPLRTVPHTPRSIFRPNTTPQLNMKTTALFSGVAVLLVASTSALPTDYPAPPGGWGNVKYPKGTGEGLPSYPNPPGGYYGSGNRGKCEKGPFEFTSTYHVVATPDQVVNGTTPTGGLAGCTGFYDFGINSDLDLICYSIKLVGFRGEYQSPARTATHVHQAAKGQSGPPRIAFPNPVGNGNERFSYGCMTGKPDILDVMLPYFLLTGGAF
jgi:CHRD domain